MGHVTLTTHLLRVIWHPYAGTWRSLPVYKVIPLWIQPFQRYGWCPPKFKWLTWPDHAHFRQWRHRTTDGGCWTYWYSRFFKFNLGLETLMSASTQGPKGREQWCMGLCWEKGSEVLAHFGWIDKITSAWWWTCDLKVTDTLSRSFTFLRQVVQCSHTFLRHEAVDWYW